MKKEKIPVFRANYPVHLNKDDKRWKEYKKQIKKRGFSGSELWNLDWVIMCFILPRLKAYRKLKRSYPGDYKSMKHWCKDLDKMIRAVEAYVEDDLIDYAEKHKEGFQLLHKHFMGLWD